MQRCDGREPNDLRPVKIHRHYTKFAAGSVLMELGDTKVLVTTTIEDKTPRFVPDNVGWLTAEYALLPGSTHERAPRERVKVSGRTHEIQRLIGRSLRACVDLTKVGERTFNIDADIIQADGGTRTASITAGYISLVDALHTLYKQGSIAELPIISPIAAISVGMLNGLPILDLNYEEDVMAEVDANLVMNAKGEIMEFQATSEKAPLSREGLTHLLDFGGLGIQTLLKLQEEALEDVLQPC